METTSPSLLSRVRDPSDAKAWREFDRRYGELIARYARRRGLQHADAEDVRQIVMGRLARALPRFRYARRRGRFRDYLARVVRNELVRAWRRPTPPRTGVYGEEPAVAGATDDPQWEEEWRHHHLRQAVRRLRKRCDARSLEIFERLLAGDSVGRAAARSGLSREAVHKVKQRMRSRLRELVAEQIRAEEELP